MKCWRPAWQPNDAVDIVIKAAAVADYRPRDVADQKIKKKTDDALTVVMDKNRYPQNLGCEENASGHLYFPENFCPIQTRRSFGKGGMKINFLVNYSWEWDFGLKDGLLGEKLKTAEVSRIDLIIRWGGRRRLSGFLPVQSVYSDIYVVDDYWPDFKPSHVEEALEWYSRQDVTLGG